MSSVVNSTESDGYDESESSSDSDSILNDMLSSLPPEKRALLETRMKDAQQQFKVFNKNQKNQKISDVQKLYPQMDEKTALLALESCDNNELLLSRRIRDEPILLQQILDMGSGKIPMNKDLIKWVDPKKMKPVVQEQASDDDDNEEWGEPSSHKRTKRSHESDDSDTSFDEYAEQSTGKRHKRKAPRIRLNEAIQRYNKCQHKKTSKSKSKRKSNRHDSDDDSFGFGSELFTRGTSKEQNYVDSIEYFHRTNVSTRQLHELGWSDARIKAFKNRYDNPNQYYYRFNDPGEPQETGAWSAKDRYLFLKQVIELGVDYSWGLFSMKIPGRVGYQCSNYYRQLIREGVIIDDNYYIDDKKQLAFKFKNRGGTKTTKRKSRKRHESEKDYEDYDNVTYEYYQQEEQNCLPGFIDCITQEEIVKPTISPYGHVLGYDTWIKLLNREPKNTCPFTKQKLTHRQLVKLTFSNIEEYRNKIINMNSSYSCLF